MFGWLEFQQQGMNCSVILGGTTLAVTVKSALCQITTAFEALSSTVLLSCTQIKTWLGGKQKKKKKRKKLQAFKYSPSSPLCL